MPLGKSMRTALLSIMLLTVAIGTADLLAADPTVGLPPQDRRSAIQVGEELERSREWLNAIEHYETVIKTWPESEELKYGLRRSKIHFGIERRYTDQSFEKKLVAMSRRDALYLFDEVLDKVRSRFVNPLSSTSYVAHGTESLYLALANDEFVSHNIPGASRSRILELRKILREQYWNKPVANRAAARRTVEEMCDLAAKTVDLPSGCVVMEYIFGGCNALDDYSNCLTPDRLSDLYDNIDGEFVGLGVEMKSELGDGLLLVNVLPDSPASEGRLSRGDHIVGINGVDCRNMTTDAAAGLLRGPQGSRVRLEYQRPDEDQSRSVVLLRRAVQVKSIPVAQIIDSQYGIGYIQMTGFQKTSAAELDVALSDLRRQGMRALIWDVRGNPGGLLTAAVEVLDRFIEQGVLVSTKGRTTDQNWTYSAHRLGTLNLPLVLLTDGDSASASEIVAGAIRDHKRGTLVGRRTYGKWSVQSIFPARFSTGLRLTTAKFYSPGGHTWGKIGVEPDVLVDKSTTHSVAYRGTTTSELNTDSDIIKGLDVLRSQIARR